MLAENRSQKVVQVIVVLDDKNDPAPRNEVLANVAKASVAAFHEHYDAGRWNEWLADATTKSVRRAKAKEFAKILELDLEHVVINDHAVAFVPVSYEELPRELMKTQVSGMNTFDDDGDFYDIVRTPKHRAEVIDSISTMDDLLLNHEPVHAVSIIVNDNLEMTTGKMAAQVAHALFAAFRAMPLAYRIEFAHRGYPVHLIHDNGSTPMLMDLSAPRVRHVVRDNGVTEIPAGSVTALVL